MAKKPCIDTPFDNDDCVFEGLPAAALGYLLKVVSIQELAEAIHTVMAEGDRCSALLG